MKVELKEFGVKGKLEFGDEVYDYTAYSPSTEVTLKLIKAQSSEENQSVVIEAFLEYWEESIVFNKKGFKNPKKEVKSILEKGGAFIEVVSKILDEVGKSAEKKD